MSAADGDPPSSEAGAAFAPTPWTTVLAARHDSATRRDALERLCRIYWPPVYNYIRRRGVTPHDAEDLTQGFFGCVLASDFLDRPDPTKGRFRGFLVGALKRFLADEYERSATRKRGGDVVHIEWETAAAEHRLAELGDASEDPGAAYERSWALTLLARALARLEAEQHTPARARMFASLKPYLSETAGPGDYARLATTLSTTRAAIALTVHRLNQRYADLVRLEVAATVADPAEVKTEIEHLRQALRP